MRRAITGQMEEINAALWSDLRKSSGEAYLTEIGMVLGEIESSSFDSFVMYLLIS